MLAFMCAYMYVSARDVVISTHQATPPLRLPALRCCRCRIGSAFTQWLDKRACVTPKRQGGGWVLGRMLMVEFV